MALMDSPADDLQSVNLKTYKAEKTNDDNF